MVMTLESCEGIWAEMTQKVQKKSHRALYCKLFAKKKKQTSG